MYSLYLDTHSSLITIVLFKDGKVAKKIEQDSNMTHSLFVMPLIDSILKEENITKNELNEIYAICGPGSFTGVRIGVTIAKTLSYCLEIPCKSLTSLEVKVACSDFAERTVVVNEKNGKFIGKFSTNNVLIGDYIYLSKADYEKFISKNNEIIIEDIEIDYEKVFDYIRTKEYTPAHNINPLYIKDLEV